MKWFKRIISCMLFCVCCALCLAGPTNMNVLAEETATIGNNDYTVYGATAELDTTMSYSGNGSGIKMSLTEAKAGISFQTEEIQAYEIGDEVIVDAPAGELKFKILEILK